MAWLAQEITRSRLRPQIDRSFTMEQIAEAHAFIETKRARGKVVISIEAVA